MENSFQKTDTNDKALLILNADNATVNMRDQCTGYVVQNHEKNSESTVNLYRM